MATLSVAISSRIKELLENGVITIGIHSTFQGNDVWARSVQPHPEVGVSVSESYGLEELEILLSGVKIKDPQPKKLDASSSEIERIREMKQTSLTLKSVPECALIGANIREYKNGPVRNLLPADSLTEHDFKLNFHELFSRACFVAEKIGTSKLVSRISSQPERLRVGSASNLLEWWNLASPSKRFLILTRDKRLPKDGLGRVHVKGAWLDAVEAMPCPFREPETQVGKEEETSGKEEESQDSSSPRAFGKRREDIYL
jgi:hypothetical protein